MHYYVTHPKKKQKPPTQKKMQKLEQQRHSRK